MALKPQNEFAEVVDPTIDNLWFNCQKDDIGNQKKIKASDMPFEVRTGGGVWEFLDTNNNADPGEGFIRFDNDNHDQATWVYMNSTDQLGLSHHTDLANAPVGSVFSVVESNEKGVQFQTTGAVIDNGTWVAIPVTATLFLGDIGKNKNVQVKGVFDGAGVLVSSLTQEIAYRSGWYLVGDTAHTPALPLIADDARVQLTNNALGDLDSTQWPVPGTPPWDPSTNKMVPSAVGDLLEIEVSFKANSGTAIAYFNLEVEVNGVVVKAATIIEAKGAGVPTVVSQSFKGPVTNDFLTHGATLWVDSSGSSDTINIWDIEFLISRSHKANE